MQNGFRLWATIVALIVSALFFNEYLNIKQVIRVRVDKLDTMMDKSDTVLDNATIVSGNVLEIVRNAKKVIDSLGHRLTALESQNAEIQLKMQQQEKEFAVREKELRAQLSSRRP